jgi:hypothetical protein
VTEPRFFAKKRIVVQAMQWNGTPEEAQSIVEWIGRPATYHPPVDRIFIQTLEGIMHASAGDWIIQGVQGEFYPCKPGIFSATYDEVPA